MVTASTAVLNQCINDAVRLRYLIAKPSTGDAILILGGSTKSNLNQCAAARARSIGLAWAEPARVLGGERDSSGCGAYRCEFSGRGDREIGRRGRGRAGAEAGDGGLIRVKSCGAATGEGLPDEARLLLPFRGRSGLRSCARACRAA